MSSTKDEKKLAEYVSRMRRRHPRLSMRQMSIEAGLHENAVQKIIRGSRSSPRAETLWALAERWGEMPEVDYAEMMRLAGKHIPQTDSDLGPTARFVAAQLDSLGTDQQQTAVDLINKLGPAGVVNLIAKVHDAGAPATWGQLREAFCRLSPEDQRVVLRMARSLAGFKG